MTIDMVITIRITTIIINKINFFAFFIVNPTPILQEL